MSHIAGRATAASFHYTISTPSQTFDVWSSPRSKQLLITATFSLPLRNCWFSTQLDRRHTPPEPLLNFRRNTSGSGNSSSGLIGHPVALQQTSITPQNMVAQICKKKVSGGRLFPAVVVQTILLSSQISPGLERIIRKLIAADSSSHCYRLSSECDEADLGNIITHAFESLDAFHSSMVD